MKNTLYINRRVLPLIEAIMRVNFLTRERCQFVAARLYRALEPADKPTQAR